VRFTYLCSLFDVLFIHLLATQVRCRRGRPRSVCSRYRKGNFFTFPRLEFLLVCVLSLHANSIAPAHCVHALLFRFCEYCVLTPAICLSLGRPSLLPPRPTARFPSAASKRPLISFDAYGCCRCLCVAVLCGCFIVSMPFYSVSVNTVYSRLRFVCPLAGQVCCRRGRPRGPHPRHPKGDVRANDDCQQRAPLWILRRGKGISYLMLI